MKSNDLIPIVYRLTEKANRAQKIPRNLTSLGTGLNSLRKAKKARPLSYKKTKN